jgi:hypothetical protein
MLKTMRYWIMDTDQRCATPLPWSLAATFACLLLSLLTSVACGAKAGDGVGSPSDEGDQPPPAMGDPAVFSSIDVSIRVSGSDAIDLDARDPEGSYPAEPPIQIVVAASVEINGGTAEGRVSGLRIYGDGTELVESASAGAPQRFTFQYRHEDLVHGQSLDLELRYQGSSFTLRLEPPIVALTSPLAEATLSADEPLTVAWVGVESLPDSVAVYPRGRSCSIDFTRTGDVTFAPERDGSGGEPPCRFELAVGWLVEVAEFSSPLRSLRVERRAHRIQRFDLR